MTTASVYASDDAQLYGIRSSRDALALPPSAPEWADMLPAQTALVVYWR